MLQKIARCVSDLLMEKVSDRVWHTYDVEDPATVTGSLPLFITPIRPRITILGSRREL